MPPRVHRSNIILIIFGVLVATLAAAICFAVDYKISTTRFKSQADDSFREIFQRVLTAEGVVSALAITTSRDERQELSASSSSLLKSYPYISAIMQLDRVLIIDRKGYLEEKRQKSQSFTIHEYIGGDAKYKFRPVGERNEYLVINSVVMAGKIDKTMIGLDIMADTDISNAVKRSLQSGNVVALVSPSYLFGGEQMLLMQNIYRGDVYPETYAERAQRLAGAVFVLLDPGKVFALQVAGFPSMSMDVSLQDPAGQDESVTLMHIAPQDGEVGFTSPIRHRLSSSVSMADRDLVLSISAGYLPTWIAFLGAVIVVLLIALATRMILTEQKRREVTDQRTRQLSNSVYQERERAEVTLRSIGDAVLTIDPNSEVTYMNPVAERLLGVAAHVAQGQQLKDVVRLVESDSQEEFDDPLDSFSSFTEEAGGSTKFLVTDDSDEPIAVDVTYSKLSDKQGQSLGSVMVIRDVSSESALKEQLSYQASHDPLTGLFNRTKFEAEIKKAIETCDPERGIGHALCYMDLDQFKVVNDTCGHMAGDQLLKKLAQVLENRVRDTDVLARLGGDEFGLLLLKCDLENAIEIADSLRLSIRQFIFTWEGKTFDIRMSIGVVALTDPHMTQAELMSAADVACYIAKDAGRDVVHAYRPEDQMVAEHHEQMLWSQKIQDALRSNNFYLMLQTMTPLLPSQQSIQIQEFLLRIRMDDGTIITPDVFIPAAERYGLMKSIDLWVIDNALKVIRDVQNGGEEAMTYLFSINLSGQSIGDPDIADMILDKLDDYKVDAGKLMLEVTETAAIANFSVAQEFINRLSEAGCRFALDDFGAGLSSFGYLKELHVDFLKIDGQFVKGMSQDSIDRMMVNNITHLGYGLGLYVIAEFVEDEETLELLREIGVHFAQGYHVQKPATIEDWKKENELKSIFIRTIH